MSLRINTQKLAKLKKGRVPTLGTSFVGVLIKNGKNNEFGCLSVSTKPVRVKNGRSCL